MIRSLRVCLFAWKYNKNSRSKTTSIFQLFIWQKIKLEVTSYMLKWCLYDILLPKFSFLHFYL